MVVYICLIILLVIIIYIWLDEILFSKKCNVPGPFPLPIFGNGLMFFGDAQNVLKVITNLCKEYNDAVPICALTRRAVILSHPKYIENIISSSELISKGSSYQFLHSWLGQGLLTASGKRWKTHRKFLTPAFHYSILQSFLPVFLKNQKILINKLHKMADERPINLFPILALAALDNITESIMGVSVQAQKNSESEYVKAIAEYEKQARVLGFVILAKIDDKKLDKTSVREEVDTFMFEGHDTVTGALAFSLYCISRHPEVQNKIVEEQKEIFGKNMLADPTSTDLQQMKYLELVIKESMRLYPPVPLIQRLITQDINIEEFHIPKDTSVFINIFGMQRNPKVFEDPLEFKPERFDTPNQWSPFNWIPFSAGPRNCIGQKYAMMELKVVLSSILRHFEVLPSEIKLELCINLVLKSKNGVNVKLRPRVFIG